jgi:hypothetical protein
LEGKKMKNICGSLERLTNKVTKCGTGIKSGELSPIGGTIMSTSSGAVSTDQHINELYKRMELRAPHIVYCDSPWQLLLITLLLPVLLRSEKQVGARQSLYAQIMPKMKTDSRLHLWHRMWLRLDEIYEKLAGVGLLDLEHALCPSDDELDGLLRQSAEARVSHLLLEDLSRRIESDYDLIDPELSGESLHVNLRTMLIGRYGSVLKEYLLRMNGLYLPNDPLAQKMCQSNVVRFRPCDLSASLLHTRISRIIRSIQFLKIGDNGAACLFFPHLCIVMKEASSLSLDSATRLHSASGAAATFGDGYSVFALGGKLVKRHIIEKTG